MSAEAHKHFGFFFLRSRRFVLLFISVFSRWAVSCLGARPVLRFFTYFCVDTESNGFISKYFWLCSAKKKIYMVEKGWWCLLCNALLFDRSYTSVCIVHDEMAQWTKNFVIYWLQKNWSKFFFCCCVNGDAVHNLHFNKICFTRRHSMKTAKIVFIS